MRFLTDKQERNRFFKFSVVGVTGTIVDFGVMNLLILTLNLPLVWAQGISFITAVINNFIWNRFWTYPDSRSKDVSKQLLQFGLINTIGILIRTPTITWLNRIILEAMENASISIPVENFVISQNLALSVTVAVILFWNFFANRYWTYGDVPIGAGGYPSTKHNNTLNE